SPRPCLPAPRRENWLGLQRRYHERHLASSRSCEKRRDRTRLSAAPRNAAIAHQAGSAWLGRDENSVIDGGSCILKGGKDVRPSQIGKVVQNLFDGFTSGKSRDNIADTDSRSPNMRSSAADFRIKGNSFADTG